ncbi:MAG: hypothetical protein ACYDBJ_18200 [Aggregatilineales bacterium]
MLMIGKALGDDPTAIKRKGSVVTNSYRGRALIELLLADQRLTLEELFQVRALLSDSPGGLAQIRPLTTDRLPNGDRRPYAPNQRVKSRAS